MKEYKVEDCPMRFKNNKQYLEDFLNKHAKAGWNFTAINQTFTRIIFERNKNR